MRVWVEEAPLKRIRTLHLLITHLLLPSTTPTKFCGTSESSAQSSCYQPCQTDDDCCSLSQRCYETSCSANYEGTEYNYCGVDWCHAAYTCTIPCPDNVCPDGMGCWANTPCDGDPPPELPADPPVNARLCGRTLDEAKETCWQPCPRGDGDCCLGLSCFDTAQSSSSSSNLGECTADYSGENRFYCGKSWCDAAYTCGEACPGGSDEECTDGRYCYADVPCEGSRSVPEVFSQIVVGAFTPSGGTYVDSGSGHKYCGTDAGDATDRCWQDCNSDNDCCFGQRCFDTGNNCGYAFYDGPSHSYCGTSRCDAISKCSVPCPNGNECPPDENCYDNTPCDSDIPSNQPFYCGLSQAEAAEKCWQPCPGGQDSECCFGQTCFNTGGACMESPNNSLNHRFCGTNKCDADHKCTTPCPNGDECPSGETCFDNTPCSSEVVPPSFEFSFCGSDQEDAETNCWQMCRDDGDCCFGQRCFGTLGCSVPNFQGSDHFFCGNDFCDASFQCTKPCPSGYDAECDIGQRCMANTPCDSESNIGLRYGLPEEAMNLAMQFIPLETYTQWNTQQETSNGVDSYTILNTRMIIFLFISRLLA